MLNPTDAPVDCCFEPVELTVHDFLQKEPAKTSRIKKISGGLKAVVDRFTNCIKALFTFIKNEFESMCRRIAGKPPLSQQYQLRAQPTPLVFVPSVEDSISQEPRLQSNTIQAHTDEPRRFSLEPALPTSFNPTYPAAGQSRLSTHAFNESKSPKVLPPQQVDAIYSTLRSAVCPIENVSETDYLVQLITSYRSLEMSDADIIASLKRDGENVRDISRAFLRSPKRVSPARSFQPRPAVIAPSPTVNQTDRTPESCFVMAPRGVNQFNVGANASCTLISSRFLEMPATPTTPESILALLNRHRNSEVHFIDAEEALNNYTSLRLAPNPWYDRTFPAPMMNISTSNVSRSLVSGVAAIISDPSIRGALVTGNNMTVAFKKIEGGKIEVFDSHGDFCATGGLGKGAYVYRCQTVAQVADFLRRKLLSYGQPARGSERYAHLSPAIQMWPVAAAC